MLYQQKIDGCLDNALKGGGLGEDFFEAHRPLLQEALIKLQSDYKEGALPHFKIPFLRKDLQEAQPYVRHFQDQCSDILILGTGGSSLGGQTLCALSNSHSPRLHFLDNIDPTTFSNTLAAINPETTGVIAISKSGSTAETMLQLLACLNHWGSHLCEQSLKEHFLVITERKSSPLFRMAERFSIPFFEHDPKLGGRFSIFSLVGVFPALLQQLDVVCFREGGASVIDEMVATESVEKFAPAMGAALNYSCLSLHKKSQSVLMPYCDGLEKFSKWYRQLWAESLGKDGKGTTPIDAMGATDQHSQLQLYLDGPKDKFFTLLATQYKGMGPDSLSPQIIDDVDLSYLYDKKLGDLFAAEQKATEETLIRNQCPTRVIHLDELNEKTLGALVMHFVFETLFMAELLNVDPFNQPAVEEGKVLAKRYLQEM